MMSEWYPYIAGVGVYALGAVFIAFFGGLIDHEDDDVYILAACWPLLLPMGTLILLCWSLYALFLYAPHKLAERFSGK